MRILLFCLLLVAQQATAQSGISFFQASWEQTLAKARAENKLIFMDAYATWCGPCKYMSANTFTDASVGAFFNKNFINTKIDMEKGEGIQLSIRYGVAAYPTLLFIDGNGKLVHKIVGAQEAAEFLETGRNALDPNKQVYTLMEKFEKQTLNATQLTELIKATKALGEPSEKYVMAYLKQNKNWMEAGTLRFMFENISPAYFEAFSYLTNNEAKIKQLLGAAEVDEYFEKMISDYAKEKANEESDTEKAVALFKQVCTALRPTMTNAQIQILQYGVMRANEEGNKLLRNKYLLPLMDAMIPAMDWSNINSLAWSVYELLESNSTVDETDRELLNAAVQWSLKSISLESNFFNNDTQAHLYYKLGDKKNARKYANMAVKLGKQAGEDVSVTEALLQKL